MADIGVGGGGGRGDVRQAAARVALDGERVLCGGGCCSCCCCRLKGVDEGVRCHEQRHVRRLALGRRELMLFLLLLLLLRMRMVMMER